MKSNFRALRAMGLVLVSMLGVVLLVSCEDDKDGAHVVLTPSPTAPMSSASSRDPVTGSWIGTSGPGGRESSLSLSERGGAVSGNLGWPNQTLSVTGTHSGVLVRVRISCGDTWRMTYSGAQLAGTGYQENGDTYGVNFKRK